MPSYSDSLHPRRSTGTLGLFLLLSFLLGSTYYFFSPSLISSYAIKPLHCPSSQSTISILPSSQLSSLPLVPQAATVENWWKDLKELDFDATSTGSLEGKSLKDLCDKTQWVNKRWMTCDGIEGGIGNVRNAVLTCLRYVIESGSGWVLPSLQIRKDSDISNLHGGTRAGLDFYFDLDHFTKNLREFCPALTIVESIYNIPDFHIAYIPQPLQPRDLFTRATGKAAYHQEMLNDHAITFRRDFDKVMSDPGPIIFHPMSYREELFPLTGRPTIVRLAWPLYFEYPIALDSPAFQRNFGLLLKFKPEVRFLATEIYNRLTSFSVDGGKAEDNKAGVLKYFGCHLRSESDAPMAFWTSVESQKTNYLDLARKKGLKVMYVAGGDPAAFEAFSLQALQTHKIRLVNKNSLLSSSSLTHLLALPFDQQALVDYLILLKSEYFSGIGASSFSHTLGLRRHLNVAGTLGTTRGGGVFLGMDTFSLIMNAEGYKYIPLTTWP